MTSLMDAVATATATSTRMYRTNAVPVKPDYPYGSFWASLGEGATRLLSTQEGLRAGRIVVQSFAKTADHAIDHAEQVRAALVGARLVVDGANCTPIVNELPPSVARDADDNGVVGVTATYTFTKEMQ